jgi:hypothetical protein
MKSNHRINLFLISLILFGMVVFIEACAAIKTPPASTPISTITHTDVPYATSTSPQVWDQRLKFASTSTSTFTMTPAPSETPASAYKPITWMELVDFLAKDHTNSRQIYLPGLFR